ncbi:hypothetical protein Taro_029167 [Colocasia esculenta]|uniref:Uncharacterized protein n=1 Tax=Colocasia esculenta TaxID=4460 RepID=A0A843VU14_COLES|nr:hypothetical protein [Colocasia esculenta]
MVDWVLIFARLAIGTARKAPIRNQHFDPVGTRRGNHMQSACHGDRKLCSTRRENSSPGIRIAYVTTIRNRHSETVDRTLVPRNSVMGSKFHHGAYAGQPYAVVLSRRSEVVFNSSRELLSRS